MWRGQSVLYMSPQSMSNGHYEQVAVVTYVEPDGSAVRLKAFPDGGNNCHDVVDVRPFADEASARAAVKEKTDAGNVHYQPVCWPNVAPAAPATTTPGVSA